VQYGIDIFTVARFSIRTVKNTEAISKLKVIIDAVHGAASLSQVTAQKDF
jgi:hypothetical protein